MANELEYYADPTTDSGLTIDAKVYDSAGVQVGADVVCTEVGTLAIYQGDMPVTGAGVYSVRFFSGGTTFEAQGKIEWDGTAEVLVSTLDDISAAEVQAELVTYDAVVPADLATLATSAEIAALNNLSAADVQAELVLYDAATGAEVAAIDSTAVKNLLEADQVKVGTTINYYLKGSGQTTLLLSQEVTGDSACDADLSIIGA